MKTTPQNFISGKYVIPDGKQCFFENSVHNTTQ